nr:Toll/interleukin-1 receptor (TIR) domain-containing protein [Tanacetum cinerariifolium]
MYCSSVLPHLSPKHSWCVAQNSEAKEDDDTQVQIFYNLHDPMSYYRCQIPELLGKRIRGCFHGCWAILSSNHPRDIMWSLWNPFTSQIISLPPLIHKRLEEDYNDITYCCLSAPPDQQNS